MRVWYAIASQRGTNLVDEQGYLVGDVFGFRSRRSRNEWVDEDLNHRRALPANHRNVRRARRTGALYTFTFIR